MATTAPYWLTDRRLPTERIVVPEKLTVFALLFMNSCSAPTTMPLYAERVIITAAAPVICVKRLRWAADNVVLLVMVAPICRSFVSSTVYVCADMTMVAFRPFWVEL